MHAIDLCDTVFLEPAKEISVSANVALPERSAARRAAEAYQAAAGTEGARIHIHARIPPEAGLGSSSADAAAVLRGMQALYGTLSDAALLVLAARIGADVPFCLTGGCALCEGIGEQITPLPSMPLDLLIVKGTRGISTKALFESLVLPLPEGDAGAAVAALRAGDKRALAQRVYNALAAPAARFAPETMEFAARLRACGAQAACMTGSGSAVFGIFASHAEAERAKGLLRMLRLCRYAARFPFRRKRSILPVLFESEKE